MPTEIPQTQQDLINALARHTRVLEAHSRKAFLEHDYDYLPEIAVKIRVLTYGGGRGRPLLCGLMEDLDCDEPFKLNGPGDRAVTLSEYMNMVETVTTNPLSGQKVEFTPAKMMATIANKMGAHEDPELPDDLLATFAVPFFFNGHQMAVCSLQSIAKTAIQCAKRLLARYPPSE